MGIGKILVLVSGLFAECMGAGRVTCPISDAHTPCVCTDSTIDCEAHSLQSFPNFTTYSLTNGHFTILKLGKNLLKSVPVAIFAALNVTEIDLSYNNITNIDPAAFAGIANVLLNVSLTHNKLATLPSAIALLSRLKTLDVSWNPIPGFENRVDGLDSNVMRAIGDTLIHFKFGDPFMRSWPHSLTHLNQLQELTVEGIFLPYWPATCFHGFELTLKALTIEFAVVATVPIGISFLTNLQELHMNHLDIAQPTGAPSLFGDDSLISAPFSTLSQSLEILSLNYDRLTTFPEAIKDLTSLRELSLDGNDLEFVSDEAIQLLIDANVSKLSLRHCGLQRVPSAISDLAHLVELDFSENRIRSIESTDLQNLNSLKTLYFDLNPLQYISDNSLCGLTKLENFYLRKTDLIDLSHSLSNLRNLHTLDLTESRIDCTCEITWIKVWKDHCSVMNNTLDILGKCETINSDILKYINDRLPNCLGYMADLQDGRKICNGTCSA